jgi:outer membrane protein TolC
LTLPLFDGGQRRAANRAETALYDAARAQYQQTVVQAVADVNNALISRQSSAAALEAAHKALEEETASAAALKRRYAAGIAAESDDVQAQMRVIERARDVARQLTRARWADIDLIEALGGDAREETSP